MYDHIVKALDEGKSCYMVFCNLIKIRSLRSLLKDLTKPHIIVKSGDLSIMHDSNVMPRCKLSSDWLNTHVT